MRAECLGELKGGFLFRDTQSQTACHSICLLQQSERKHHLLHQVSQEHKPAWMLTVSWEFSCRTSHVSNDNDQHITVEESSSWGQVTQPLTSLGKKYDSESIQVLLKRPYYWNDWIYRLLTSFLNWPNLKPNAQDCLKFIESLLQ